QLQIGLPVQQRHLGLGKPVLENRCPDDFRWRKVGVLGQLPQKTHLLLSHPEGVPKGAFFCFLFWWSCHCIDEQSELKAWGQAFWSDQNMACSPKQGLLLRHTAGPVFFLFGVWS